MPKEVIITAVRHPHDPTGNEIRFTRRLKWSDRPNFAKFIEDYAIGIAKRLFRVAGSGNGIKVNIDEKN